MALLCAGFVASLVLVPGREGPVLRAAWTALLSYVAVPLPALAWVAATGATFSAGLELGLAAAVCVGGALVLRRRARVAPVVSTLRTAGPDEPLVAAGVLMTGLLASAWYSDAKAMVAYRSYLTIGDAECFYLFSFRLWDGTNPGATAANVREAFSIITTPGNLIFSAGIMPATGFESFRVAYVVVAMLLFVLAHVVARDAGASRTAAFIVATFAVANPYTLSIEELDRNQLALVCSLALFHALHAHPGRALLHGLLLGVAAGTGLRFLPITLAASVALSYAIGRRPLGAWLVASAVAAFAFAPNLPHLALHGFHSMGENSALPLLAEDGGLLSRTPFLALPNVLFYPAHLLGLLGAVAVSVLAVGAFALSRARPLWMLTLVAGFVPTFFVLATQRDWIEGDKHRILLWAFAPVFASAGAFVDAALKRPARTLLATLAVLALVWAGGSAVAGLETRPDEGSPGRKPVYQRETPAFAALNRTTFTDFGLAPAFDRLFQKPRLARKALYEAHLRRRLGLDDSPAPPAAWRVYDNFVDLRIDFDALVVGGSSVRLGATAGDRRFMDLERPADWFDVYQASLSVAWQPEPLPVTALPDPPLVTELRELTLELNAFASVGPDADGFEQVVPLHRARVRTPPAPGEAMLALPHPPGKRELVLRVPRDFRVVLRDWYLNAATGAPYRTDGWEIVVPTDGLPTARFYPMEPETHL